MKYRRGLFRRTETARLQRSLVRHSRDRLILQQKKMTGRQSRKFSLAPASGPAGGVKTAKTGGSNRDAEQYSRVKIRREEKPNFLSELKNPTTNPSDLDWRRQVARLEVAAADYPEEQPDPDQD